MKFGFLAGVLTIWFVLFGALIWVRLDDVRRSVDYVTEKVEPRSQAAYEMEINAIGTSLAVVKYLRSPKPAYIARFEDDAADFWTFHQRYVALAEKEAELGLSKTIAASFSDLENLGRQIIAEKDSLVVDFERLTGVISEIEEIEKRMPTVADKEGEILSAPAVMRRFVRAIEGLEHALAVAGWSSRVHGEAEIEQIRVEARASISRLSLQELSPSEAALATQLSEAFATLEQDLARFRENQHLIERNFIRLVEKRQALDDLLDEQIQALAAREVVQAHNDITQDVGAAFDEITALWGGSMVILTLTMLLLSTIVVLPIRRLAEVATAFGRGQLNRRIGSSRRDEIGNLTRALDEMARNLLDAQRTLEQANSQLEATVVERTQQLVEANQSLEEELEAKKIMMQKLQDATKLAEAANRAKTSFLANMSHEFRTPLNGILGLAEMIQMKIHGPLENERYEEYLRDIQESGRHLLRHVNDVLEVSNLELGRPVLTIGQIDVRKVIDRSVALTTGLAERKGVMLETEVSEDLPQVVADENRVEQILCNLIENAIKFSPEGTRVLISALVKSAYHVSVRIADNGPGMSQEEVAAALTLFGAAEPTRANRDRGLGLGLHVSKRIIEMLGGTLKLDTAPGRGTVVTLGLPRHALGEGLVSGPAKLDASEARQSG